MVGGIVLALVAVSLALVVGAAVARHRGRARRRPADVAGAPPEPRARSTSADVVPPTGLIDPASGAVVLRLVPFHLERLHGRSGAAPARTAEELGLPFPFLDGARPVDVTLHRGMAPEAVRKLGGGFEPNGSLGTRSWWQWASYALTPFGWVSFPTPFFERGRLSALTLQRHGSVPAENFAAMRAWLVRDLGAPRDAASDARRQVWEFEWGSATLFFEPRDGAAQLTVEWKPTPA